MYARYSSSNQTEQSIEGQVHVCQDFAKRNNIIIVDSYIDRAISGTTDERDSFQRMLKDSDNRKWDYVLVYKLDRFARNKYEAAIHRKHLKDNGIKLLSAMENIPETPRRRFTGITLRRNEPILQRRTRTKSQSWLTRI
ncbi:MAG: recombinase family protein [Clostridia bacterium]|nr:recombinase family protein [Clostridia bacterium]